MLRYTALYKDAGYAATSIESTNLQQITLKYKSVLQSVSHLDDEIGS